jgi:putative Holliday junction resolvase
MKLLAIDFGKKRMGFAIGNAIIHTAAPIDPITRKDEHTDIQYINHLLDEYDISKIIIGYPLNMDGTRGAITLEVEAFAEKLKKEIAPGIEIDFIDERLSSFEAEEMLKSFQQDYKKRKKNLDSISAMVLLRSYMETGRAL